MLLRVFYAHHDCKDEKSRSLFSRGLLGCALTTAGVNGVSSGINGAASDTVCGIEIVRDKNGKPYLKNNAAHFNISHTHDIAVCAVSDRPVGVDAERERDSLLRIEKRILSDGDYSVSIALPAEKRLDFLLKRWVMSEAYVKLTGKGIGAILREPIAFCEVNDALFKTSDGTHLHLYALENGCAVCVATNCADRPTLEKVPSDAI